MGWVIRLADREADLIALPHFEFARAGCVVLVVVISNGDFVERGMGVDRCKNATRADCQHRDRASFHDANTISAAIKPIAMSSHKVVLAITMSRTAIEPVICSAGYRRRQSR